MPAEFAPKNLVRWGTDGSGKLGSVASVNAATRVITVAFDDGTRHDFAEATAAEVIGRVVLDHGQSVRVLASDESGMVTNSEVRDGVLLYKVHLARGGSRLVIENGVRPAVQTDPVARLRSGQLDRARHTNLRLAATRLLFAYRHDELSVLGNSRVELKPHQVGVVHRVAEAYPHRFILADEVGLGKTIEAGLLIRELQARGVAQRILVLAPSGLVGQWQQELKTKFNQSFSIYTRQSIDWLRNDHPEENVWTVRDTVISSTSFACRDEERRAEIAGAGWDMVVIDEAHHARRTWQSSGSHTTTNLYRLAEQLADPDLNRSQSMLLLTATPMQLHRFELFSLIELLDPALFPTFDDFDAHADDLRGLNELVERLKRWPALDVCQRRSVVQGIEEWTGRDAKDIEQRADDDLDALVEEAQAQHRLSQVMVRNRKRVVGGFQPRKAAIWEVELTEAEYDAYWAATHYAQTGYARSRATKNNALGFLMATFQKLNASSSRALAQSLRRRIARLRETTLDTRRSTILAEIDDDEVPTDEQLEVLLAEASGADAEEIAELEVIVEQLESIDVDSKLRVLASNLAQVAAEDDSAKVIIFTQFRATQEYIVSHLKPGWSVHLFHGGLPPRDKDAAVAAFRDGTGPEVMVTTEAGGEGRNFQFCHILVNYDLPWNPMRVEQRIGRVDRIGQKRPVKIFNFSTRGTIEERVVDVLTERIGVFTETIGGLDPILGEVETDLRKIFLAADAEADERLAELEGQLEERVKKARATEDRLADLIMDTRSYRQNEVEALLDRPREVNAPDVKRFTLTALTQLGVKVDTDPLHPGVYELRFSSRFEDRFPDEVKAGRDRKVTFELELALAREELDFLAFGHPIVDGLVAMVRERDWEGIASHRLVLTDDVAAAQGWFFVYVLEMHGFVRQRELLPVFVHEDGRLDDELARWLLARSVRGKREDWPGTKLPTRGDQFEMAVAEAEAAAVDALLSRQGELEATNADRLAAEVSKRERFWDYRATAAADKLTADSRVRDKWRASEDDQARRILPVWEKRVDNAHRLIQAVDRERTERLAELRGREQVSGQHELYSASYVEIEPDPRPLFEQVRDALPPKAFETFRRVCTRPTPEQLVDLPGRLAKRRAQLAALAARHTFDAPLALAIADALLAATSDLSRYGSNELMLLHGAAEYYLLIDDHDHDLKSPHGFEDDAIVANIVLETVGRPELVVEMSVA